MILEAANKYIEEHPGTHWLTVEAKKCVDAGRTPNWLISELRKKGYLSSDVKEKASDDIKKIKSENTSLEKVEESTVFIQIEDVEDVVGSILERKPDAIWDKSTQKWLYQKKYTQDTIPCSVNNFEAAFGIPPIDTCNKLPSTVHQEKRTFTFQEALTHGS